MLGMNTKWYVIFFVFLTNWTTVKFEIELDDEFIVHTVCQLLIYASYGALQH